MICYFGCSGLEGSSFVAVKTLKESAGDKERQDLLKELQVMKSLKPHPNIVTLLGCCTDKGNLLSNLYIRIMLYSSLAKTIELVNMQS
jgi:serine/threonine protein kinase